MYNTLRNIFCGAAAGQLGFLLLDASNFMARFDYPLGDLQTMCIMMAAGAFIGLAASGTPQKQSPEPAPAPE